MKIMGFGDLVSIDACGGAVDVQGNAISYWKDYGVVGYDDGTQSYYAAMDFDDVEISIGHMPRIGTPEELMSELNVLFSGELIFDHNGIDELGTLSR